MTIEEKIYINSLDDKEFKRLIEYLKVKSRELQWRGNDLGSGHYNELYIKIDRDTERYLNVWFSILFIFKIFFSLYFLIRIFFNFFIFYYFIFLFFLLVMEFS